MFCFNTFGQIIIENAENQNFLYRGYQNKFIIGVAGSNYDSLKLDNGTFTSTTFNGVPGLIIVPSGGGNCNLYALKYNGSSIDTVDSRFFKVRPLPKPNLYWGSSQDGEKAIKSQNRLNVSYGPEVFMISNFEIVSWESKINGKTLSGNGSQLSTEFLKEVKNLKGDQTICIEVVFKGDSDNIGRTAGCWQNQ
jgi:hypothetical protein